MMSDIEMRVSAHAIITLGRGRSPEEDSDAYSSKCADAARCLANANPQNIARAVFSLNNNQESNGPLFIADALKILAKIAQAKIGTELQSMPTEGGIQ
jgi:hypothetical protein